MREIVGTPDTCLQRLGDYVDLGVSEFLLTFPELYRPEILHEFSNEVMDRF